MGGDDEPKDGASEPAPKVYRVMTPDGDVPQVGPSARKLGVRVHPMPNHDVKPDGDGNVGPDRYFEEQREGMSVAPSLSTLPFHRVPARLLWLRSDARGNNKDRVFRLGEGPFVRSAVADDLELAPDDVEEPEHGVIQPKNVMPVAVYQAALAATKTDWFADEPTEGGS